MSHNAAGFLWTSNLVKLLTEKRTLKASFFSRKGNSRGGEKHSTASCVFPYTSFVLYHFLRALQQNRALSRLLYLLSNVTKTSPVLKASKVSISLLWEWMQISGKCQRLIYCVDVNGKITTMNNSSAEQ